jgi:hypothetical protein
MGEILWMLVIPAIALGAMIGVYRHKVTWKEAALQFGVPALILVATGACFYFSQTTDVEYLNSYAKTAYYEEEWDEQITWTEQEACGTDSEGNTKYRTVTKTRIDTHSPKWYVKDNCGGYKRITKGLYNELTRRWNNEKFKDMHRDYHSNDGNMEPFTWTKSYKNKVQASDSVFTEIDVDEDDVKFWKLFDYNPCHHLTYNPLYGWADKGATEKLTKANAWNGKRKQLHMNILVFIDQPSVEAALYQQSYWKGGNKNEYNVCVGLKGQQIEWCKVISWTEVDILKLETEQAIVAMGKFDAELVADWMIENVPQKWIRKEFADFEYISISIPTAGKVTSFVLICISTVGMCIVTHRMDIR